MFKRIIPILTILSFLGSLHGQDTTIFNTNVSISSNLSSYDNVEIVAVNTVSFSSGFSFSANGDGGLTVDAGIYSVGAPEGFSPDYNSTQSSNGLDLDLPVGAIQGRATVSPSGGATYAIPIQIPQGNNGMIPELAIGYNSQGGSGIMGRGWNLSGISAIMATGKNKYYDGEVSVISATDSSNRLVWDGQRLFGINSDGFDADSFKTEISSNVKIKKDTGTNYVWFTIKTPDGKTLEYGNTTDSRMSLDANIEWKWMLSKVKDRNGNEITYTYQYDGTKHQTLLSTIEYGGSSGSTNEITFHYSTGDVSYAYINNDLVVNDQILDSLSIESNNQFFGKYEFEYKTTTGEYLLDEVIQYDKDLYSYNSTKIDWDSPTFNKTPSISSQSLLNLPSAGYYQYFTGDFTGDGFSDLLAINSNLGTDQYAYYLYRGSSSGLSSTYNTNDHGDIPRSYTTQYWEEITDWYNDCCQQTTFSSTPGVNDVLYFLAGDFDGDGIHELFVKVLEWTDLAERLPDDLNTYTMKWDFDIEVTNLFGDTICDFLDELEDPTTIMQWDYGIGRFINLDKVPTDLDRITSFRLGESSYFMLNKSPLPDLDGRGYNCISDEDSIYYFDPIEEKFISFCESVYKPYWGEFNGDGKADYIDMSNYTSSFPVKKYDPATNSFSSLTTLTDDVLGLIDINGDGISGWVLLGSATYGDKWNSICSSLSSCYPGDNNAWYPFLYINQIEEVYNDYVDDNCGGIDNYNCRFSFLGETMGKKLYIDHYDNHGPEIEIEYIDETITKSIAADINSDGKSDLLLFNGDDLVKFYYDFEPTYSNGNITYTFSEQDCNYALGADVQTGDFNGDGIIDLIGPGNNKKLCFITSGQPGKLASTITNGLGVETSFFYEPLTDSTLYASQDTSNYPVIDFISPMYVVSSVSSDNGVANSVSVDYEYEGAKIHLKGKGFLGFMKTTVKNTLLNSSQIANSTYNTNCFYTYPLSSSQKIGTTTIQSNSNSVSVSVDSDKVINARTNSSTNVNSLQGITTTTSLTYNNDGLISEKITDVDGDATVTESYTYTSAGWYTASLLQYHSIIYERSDSIVLDSTYMSYDTTGNLSFKKAFSGTDRELTTRYSNFNAFGSPRKITTIGKRGTSLAVDSVWTDISYSSCGRFITSKKGSLNTNIYYDYDFSSGTVESQTTVNNLETSYQYGPFSRKTGTIQPDLMQEASKLFWAEGHDDAPTGSLFYNWATKSGNPPVLTFCDAVGRELRTVTEGFDNEIIYADKEYDTKGRVIRRSLPYSSTDSPQWDSISYDSYGRITEESLAEGTTTEYDYSIALETTISVSKGSISQSSVKTVNVLGETIESEDNDGNIVYNNYYPDGKLKESYTSVYPGMKTTFTYDALGKRISISDPDAGTISSLYDGFGNLLRQIDARGDTITFVYDDIGRTLESTDNRGDINFVYITDTTDVAFGQIDSIYNTDGSLSESFTYDADYGRLLSSTKRIPDKTFTNSYTYDWFGRPWTRTYPSGFEITYSYTGNGDLKKINGDGQTIWECDDVNKLGQITSYSQGSYSTTVDYDDDGMLEEVTTGSVFNMKYGFTDAGNLEYREDVLTAQKEEFAYDDLNRLTGIDYYDNTVHNSLGDLDLTYSDGGNITSKTDVSTDINYAEYNTGPHALTSIEDPVSAYKPPPQVIDYTCFNKVSTIQDTVGQDTTLTLAFTYGLNNQRVKTVLSRNTTVERIKYFDGEYEEDSTSTGTKKYHYINSPTGLIGIFVKEWSSDSIYEGSADTLYHVLSDHLSSLNGVINAETDSVIYYSYNAWGIPRDPDDWTSEFEGDLFAGRGYTGHEHLLEFNLINMNGRVYDPVLGRFLSPDPYVQAPGYAGSFNRYSYCLNNPLVYTDPDGEFFTSLFLGPLGVIIDGACWGALLGGASYTVQAAFSDGGLQNWNWSGFGKAAGIGAISGAVTAGVGSLMGPLGGGFSTLGDQVLHEFGRAFSHGVTQGMVAGYTGGDPLQAFVSAGLGSIGGSSFNMFAPAIASSNIGGAAFATLSGGLGAEISGGDFLEGATLGLMNYSLNHMRHDLTKIFVAKPEKIHYNPKDKPNSTAAHLLKWMRWASYHTDDGRFDLGEAFYGFDKNSSAMGQGFDVWSNGLSIGGRKFSFFANAGIYSDLSGTPYSTVVDFTLNDQLLQFHLDGELWQTNKNYSLGGSKWGTQKSNYNWLLYWLGYK